MAEKLDYEKSQILDWWHDYDVEEYIVIMEHNKTWYIVSTKVENPNG